jgi:chromosome segregation ATPase
MVIGDSIARFGSPNASRQMMMRTNESGGVSYNSPNRRSSWREGRDDLECDRDGAEMISDDAMDKFDNMLKRIESERNRIVTKETHSRVGTLTPRLTERRISQPIVGGCDFARRAKELRMSDGIPSRSRYSMRSDVTQAEDREMTTRRDERWESMSDRSQGRNAYSCRSAGNTPLRSYASSIRPPLSPPRSFSLSISDEVESRLGAHDAEKDEYISILEQRNKALNDTLLTKRHEPIDFQEGSKSDRYKEEFDKMRFEFDNFKKEARDIRKRSAESESKVEEIQREKKILVDTVNDKDETIGILRKEIQRLSEELADGSFARGKALKAEETVKKLEAELEKSVEDHLSTSKVIVDLEIRMQEKTKEFDSRLSEKDKEIAALQLELSNCSTMKQNSEWVIDKACTFESQLNESRENNKELTDKVKELTTLLEKAEIEAQENKERMIELKSSARELEAREKELEKEQRELELQRARVEKFDAGCASEQETVAALEQAIADLEKAQHISAEKITKLQTKNETLTTTLEETEEYMKLYEKDIERTRKLKDMMGELQEINTDLGNQLEEKNDHIRNLQSRIASIEMQVESSNAASQQAIQHLESSLSREQKHVSKLQAELSSSNLIMQDQEINAKQLEALSATFEQLETELEYLRSNKREMQGTIMKLEEEVVDVKTDAYKRSHSIEGELEASQEEAKNAWARISELEESVQALQHKLDEAEQQDDDETQLEELISELSSTKTKLAERDEQLEDSRKGIAEAKKMIFRLMNTLQDVRRKSMESSPIESVTTDESSI